MDIKKERGFRLPKDPILIVEDKKENQDLLRGICKRMEVPVFIAENGQVALEFIKERSFSLYIVDLMMPVMDGRAFIIHLKKKIPDAVIIVQSALDSAETIIDIMKMGVTDYVVKPIDPEVFQRVIIKSLNYLYLKDAEKDLSLHSGEKIKAQLDWLNYKEEIRVSEREYSETKSIHHLVSSLSQGAGFGSLLSMIDVMYVMKEDKGDYYSIDKEIVDSLFQNYEYCTKQIEGLNSITEILNSKFKLEIIDSASIIEAIPGMFTNILPFLEKKKLRITYPEVKINCSLYVNMEKLSLLIEELVINAYKYSQHNTVINIFTNVKEGYFWLSIINVVPEDPYGGIPKEYERMVVEPFFRLLPGDESIAKVEKFSFGLGLCVADNITRKHNGTFIIHEVKNHIGKNIQTCVLAEIILPVALQ